MLTQMTDGQLVAATDTATEQDRTAVEGANQRIQDLMIQLVRQGLDISLRSLQVWADLARQLSPNTLGSPAGAMMVALTYDLFEKLLAAQRQAVEELIATQRQFAQQFLQTATTVGNDLTRR